MQFKSIHFGPQLLAKTCAICAPLLLMPTVAPAQSLLETWVFAHYRGLIPIDQLKEASDGTLVPPDHPQIRDGGAEIWSVIDRPNCVVRVEYSASGISTDYYLNNMSAVRPTTYNADGGYQIGLMGDRPVHCRYGQSEKSCEHFTTLVSSDANGYRAIDKALNRIYAKFCRGSGPAPKFQ